MGIGSFNLVRPERSSALGESAFQPPHIFHNVTGNLGAVFKLKSSLCQQMLSLLPSRVLRLMEFLGFSGDRVSVDLAQPCRLFLDAVSLVVSFEHAYHFPGAGFVRAETGSSKQQPAVNPQHLDSPHVPPLHYCHPR